MTTFQIISRIPQPNGILYSIAAADRLIQIRFTNHAVERINMWRCTEEQVLETLFVPQQFTDVNRLFPEEIITGHHGRFIAHRRYNRHIVRAIYEYEGDIPVLVTVYFPYAVEYFQGGGVYANKIFSRC